MQVIAFSLEYFKGLGGVITDLEPDILECEVKSALESIITNKASGAISNPER